MTNDEFKIWLSGFFDLEKSNVVLSARQLWIIHNHLRLAEATSGELDEDMRWLKVRLENLHVSAAGSFMSEEFKRVTGQIVKWL